MTAYSRDELERIPVGEWPTRGEHCPKCRNFIPSFDAVDDELERELRAMPNPLEMMKLLKHLTGCPLGWAKLWSHHPDGAHQQYGHSDAPPCPHCGEQLRTALAKQCVECGADWH